MPHVKRDEWSNVQDKHQQSAHFTGILYKYSTNQKLGSLGAPSQASFTSDFKCAGMQFNGVLVCLPSGFATGITPYFLRAVRILVLYHASYRRKWAGLVKWKNLRKMWASIALSFAACAALFFVFSDRQHRFVIAPRTMKAGGCCVLVLNSFVRTDQSLPVG